jgi:citrate synthase
MTARAGWLSAAETMALLGIRPQTLYAYVTRGRIGAKVDPDDPRRSLYRAADVRQLAQRRKRGRAVEAVAAGTIAWGDPILPTAIATIAQERLFYRGRDATDLAETATLEQVAALLWNAKEFAPSEGVSLLLPPRATDPDAEPKANKPKANEPKANVFTVLAARAGTDEPAFGRAPAALQAEAAALVTEVVGVFAPRAARDVTAPIHRRLATQWGCDAAGADAIRRALVLLADHELNASTFAARVTASTGASLAASVLAGLCALSGPLHGGAALQVYALIAEAERAGAEPAIRAWLAQGRPIPGFGHPLYPGGDPRANALLRAFRPTSDMAALATAVENMVGERPNIDFALAVLANALRLPHDAAFILFLVARCAGWLAHALEQVASGYLIRPRARYVGPPVALERAG